MKKNGAFTILLILFTAFIVVLTYIFFHMENLRIGYKIEAVRKERDRLKEEIDILQIESAKLRNLKRVEKIARELGMKEMERDQIVTLSSPEVEGLEKGLYNTKIARRETNVFVERTERR